MSAAKINLIFLPLLFSILLSTVGKLKLGHDLNTLIYNLLTPIQTPLKLLKNQKNQSLNLLSSLPSLSQQNALLKSQNNALLTENQNLKNLLHDQFLINEQKHVYTQTIPVRVLSVNQKIAVTTSLDISDVKIGQPAISNQVLIGLVSDIEAPIIYLTPLTQENFPNINLTTQSNQKGNYQYASRTSQLINLPSETDINLNDTVFTQVSEMIPANLIIGKITRLITTKESPLQKAEIKLETDPQTLSNLLIITKP